MLLSWIVPQALGMLGELVLHATAIEPPGMDGAVLFAGPARAGKSTLAAVAAANGCRVLSDDGVRVTASVGGFRCHPGLRGARIRTVGANGLERRSVRPLAVDSQCHEPLPLLAVVALTRRGETRAPRRLSTMEAVAALTNNRLSLIPELAQQQTDRFVDVVRDRTIVAGFPDDVDQLPRSLNNLWESPLLSAIVCGHIP